VEAGSDAIAVEPLPTSSWLKPDLLHRFGHALPFTTALSGLEASVAPVA
jgi:hypothetical protein